MGNDDPIQHVVVLMLENHSFDQMLGCMKDTYPELVGVDVQNNPHSSPDFPDTSHEIAQLNFEERSLDPDPMHEHVNVLRQLDAKYGFVVDYAQSYPHTGLMKRAYVMGVYPRGSLPVLQVCVYSDGRNAG